MQCRWLSSLPTTVLCVVSIVAVSTSAPLSAESRLPGTDLLTLYRLNVEQERNQARSGKLSPAVFCWRLSKSSRS